MSTQPITFSASDIDRPTSQTPPNQQPQPAQGQQPQSQPQPQSAPAGPMTFNVSDIDSEPQAKQGEPSAEEQEFLKNNPDHQWVSADPSKPNTQPGIYPVSYTHLTLPTICSV